MIKSLTKDLHIMADALRANGVLNFSRVFDPDSSSYDRIFMDSMKRVMEHGTEFSISYDTHRGQPHILFGTWCDDLRIECLISVDEYTEWMREHPDTPVNDRTGGADKHADILHR